MAVDFVSGSLRYVGRVLARLVGIAVYPAIFSFFLKFCEVLLGLPKEFSAIVSFLLVGIIIWKTLEALEEASINILLSIKEYFSA